MLWHGRDEFVEHAALPKQRVGASLGRVGFEGVVQNPPFLGYTRRAETAGL